MVKRWCKLVPQWLMTITLCVLAGCEGEPIDPNHPSISSSSSSYSNPNTSSAPNISSSVSSAISSSSDATSRPFITTWKTDAEDGPNNDEILIRTKGDKLNYHIDWGDGSIDHNITTEKIKHTYAVPGTYTVSITGQFPQLYNGYFFSDPDVGENVSEAILSEAFAGYTYKLMSVEQWGSIQWKSMNRFFAECINVVINATDTPDLSHVTSMYYMFYGASAFNQDISAWGFSSITDMSGMFAGARSFNQDVSTWDVSSVTDMSGMFGGATAFNQDLSAWDVSSVTDMSVMFGGATAFNQDLSAWDVSSATDMSGMFFGATAFNQDLSAWDVSSVTAMSEMFIEATAFNQDLSAWDVSSVTDMILMFAGAEAFNQDLSTWDVSSVTDMISMFAGATAFNQDLSAWEVSSVTDMTDMFSGSLSTANYDALLIGWSQKQLQTGAIFSAGTSQYSSAAQSAKDILTNQYGWDITDGGLNLTLGDTL